MTRQQHRLPHHHCSHRRCNACLPLRMSRLPCNNKININHSHRTKSCSIHNLYQSHNLHTHRLDMPFHNAWIPRLQPIHLLQDPFSSLHSPFHHHRHSALRTKAQHTKMYRPLHLMQTHKPAIAANKRKLLVSLVVDASQRYLPSCLSFLLSPAVRCLVSSIHLLLWYKAMSTLPKGTIVFRHDMQSERAETMSALAVYCLDSKDFLAF